MFFRLFTISHNTSISSLVCFFRPMTLDGHSQDHRLEGILRLSLRVLFHIRNVMLLFTEASLENALWSIGFELLFFSRTSESVKVFVFLFSLGEEKEEAEKRKIYNFFFSLSIFLFFFLWFHSLWCFIWCVWVVAQ